MTDQPSGDLVLAHAAHMPAPQGGALPTGLEWQALERMATTLAESDVIPYRLKRKPADVAVILLAAREYGIPPLMALSKLPVVNGTPAPMGELMVALVLRAGHRIRVTVEGEGGPVDAMVAVCTTRRRDEDSDDVLRFTFAEAKAAGLVSVVDGKPYARDQKGNPTPWELYPVNMLRWRAVANACRLRFPDVLLGMSYLPEELGAVVDAEGAPIEGEPVGARGSAPSGSIEQRTAQEAADRLAGFDGPAEVLDRVLAHATDNGYAGQSVRVAGVDYPTLAHAITDTRDRLTQEPDAEPVDAELVEDETTAEEPTTAPPAAQEPPVEGPAQETPLDAAYDVAREALASADEDLLRALYRGAGELRAIDVLGVIGDDDLAALDAPADLPALPLGTLLMRVADYVKRHGAAVRDLGAPDSSAQVAEPDPWAADAAAGWPDVNRPPE